MSGRTRLAAMATALAVAFVAPAGHVEAQPPDSTIPTEAPPRDTDEADPDPFGLEVGDEITHSWALTPAGADDASGAGARPDLSYSGSPGAVIEDAVTLYNLGNEQLTFSVYGADTYNNAEGTLDLLTANTPSSDVGSWVDLAQDLITVPPGRKVTIPFTLTIPDDARPGDHIGAILAGNEALSSGEGGELVTLDRRTGTPLIVRVAGPLRAELAITGLSTDYQTSPNPLGGSMLVKYRIENRGNVRMSGTHAVSVAGPFGVGRRRVPPVEVINLLPGQGIDINATVDGVPTLGIASTDVVLDPQPSGDGLTSAPSSQGTRNFAPPIVLLIVLLLVILAALIIRARRRHRAAGAGAELVSGADVEYIEQHQPT